MKFIYFSILLVLFLFIFPMFFIQYFVANHLFKLYLTRNDKEDWSRELIPETEEEKLIFDNAIKFENDNKRYIKDVEITSDNLKLKGQFVDYGFNKTVILVAGRSEALRYCYHFAFPYKDLGYNVLAIDNRGHGLSEGDFNYLGFKEYIDVLNWIKYLHDALNQKEIIGHGICIGGTTLLYALTNKECPKYFKGIIVDGMFQNFALSFNNHAKESGHGIHFVSDFFFAKFKHKTGFDIHDGPINYVDKLDKPILFIYSKQDHYSTLDKSLEMFEKCNSKEKEIKIFDNGIHSHVRINNMVEYDKTIQNFAKKYFMKGE